MYFNIDNQVLPDPVVPGPTAGSDPYHRAMKEGRNDSPYRECAQQDISILVWINIVHGQIRLHNEIGKETGLYARSVRINSR
jgi:hypothetical protein